MDFDPEFKRALELLPGKEKDKLILRLLKKDLKLASKLHFELVDTDSVQDKREQLKNEIVKDIKRASERYYSPGYLLMDARTISGKINEHVYIAKDKVGEITLNCTLLRQLLKLNNGRIAAERSGKAYTLNIYIVARIFKILMLIQKQHEDLHLEFRDDIEAIGNLVGSNSSLMKTASHNGLDINWLIRFDIPANIADIYKDLRERGLLK
jgi:hypothetical protein